MKRMKLKITLIILVITFAIIGGIMIPAHLHSGGYVDVSAEENQEDLSALSSSSADQRHELLPNKKEGNNKPSTDAVEFLDTDDSRITETLESSDVNIISEVNEPDYDWVEARIEKHRSEIHDDDLEDFRLIMRKLDLGHISAIVNGEIPGDVEQMLREYLLSQLDAREYERSKTLFMLYNHLMYEEE